MKSTDQLDLYRHSPGAMAQAYLDAADAARRNPYESPERAERRAKHYEAEAARLKGEGNGRAPG